MTRYPRKIKRIKHVQIVERPIPSCKNLHPEKRPELFGTSKSVLIAKRDLQKKLEKEGWQHIRFDYKPNGVLTIYGQCLRDPVVEQNAKAGKYDLYLEPPKHLHKSR